MKKAVELRNLGIKSESTRNLVFRDFMFLITIVIQWLLWVIE